MADKDEDKEAKVEGAEETPEIAPEAQAQIDKLKKDLDLATAARDEAVRRANEHAKVANTAAAQVEDTNMQLVETAIETMTGNLDNLKARYREALSSQDYDAAADIQLEMTTGATKLIQLQAGKAAMEDEKKNPKRVVEDPRRGDPVEALAQTLTPLSAAWVRAHPQFVTNERLNRKMIRAHEDAIDEGCPPDSKEYFTFVENRLGVTSTPAKRGDDEDDGDALSAAAATKKKRDGEETPPAALPVGQGGGTKKGNVRLNADQKEMAKNMGMTEEEYANSLRDLKAEGRIH